VQLKFEWPEDAEQFLNKHGRRESRLVKVYVGPDHIGSIKWGEKHDENTEGSTIVEAQNRWSDSGVEVREQSAPTLSHVSP
jgi:regulatory protein YycI of two-component signal transduction system YycFG